ncbi:MAG TPA: alkaline phosphatase family protein [Candidatus Eremiobacteraceae bacterium]|nr:alkaline phosphatase family protein [Candidatus Eremiobacteraceae bacterium]
MIAVAAATAIGAIASANPAAAAVTWHSSVPQLQHIIIIMQENRSFDSYFGTYPGANGIPMRNGKPTVCNPDPNTGKCVAPYLDFHDINQGGPHDAASARTDIDGGKMDGFIATAKTFSSPDSVMAYHDGSMLTNYWTYAQQYVLQDDMFAPSLAYSLPEHIFLVSNWSAYCPLPSKPSTCMSSFVPTEPVTNTYGWTDITWLLHAAHVPWRYFVFGGQSGDVINPDEDDGVHGIYVHQDAKIGSQWNPLPAFTDVVQDGQLDNIIDGSYFYKDAAAGTLPAVSWVIPEGTYSEHPPNSIKKGMAYVTGLVNAVMSGPDWNTSAIFIAWDDWGGLYDHVAPPIVDWGGYGIRVPGLLISPWAQHNVVDHQLLSFDAYNKLIEDLFLNSQRLDPTSDGRPDPRPDVREAYPPLGNLLTEFDFSQRPRPPMLLRNAIIHP